MRYIQHNSTQTANASRTSEQPPPSVLAGLRSLIPRRALSIQEALELTERQATWLLRHFEITDPAVPIELITQLPRIRLRLNAGIPVSGSAHWDGHSWVLTVNSTEPLVRQRFSLFHELKHVIDHPLLNHLTAIEGFDDAAVRERLADHFAACVLMPRRWVKGAWCGGLQKIADLADRFEVSEQAMRIRLNTLGLVEPQQKLRCRPRHPVQLQQIASQHLATAGGVEI